MTGTALTEAAEFEAPRESFPIFHLMGHDGL